MRVDLKRIECVRACARVRARACNFSNDNDDTTLYSYPSLFGKMCFLSLRHENLNWLQIISILPSFGEHFWKLKATLREHAFRFCACPSRKKWGPRGIRGARAAKGTL